MIQVNVLSKENKSLPQMVLHLLDHLDLLHRPHHHQRSWFGCFFYTHLHNCMVYLQTQQNTAIVLQLLSLLFQQSNYSVAFFEHLSINIIIRK